MTLARYSVALFTRAWIEISSGSILLRQLDVALFTRAWIEILDFGFESMLEDMSPSSRGRGLKFLNWET